MINTCRRTHIRPYVITLLHGTLHYITFHCSTLHYVMNFKQTNNQTKKQTNIHTYGTHTQQAIHTHIRTYTGPSHPSSQLAMHTFTHTHIHYILTYRHCIHYMHYMQPMHYVPYRLCIPYNHNNDNMHDRLTQHTHTRHTHTQHA